MAMPTVAPAAPRTATETRDDATAAPAEPYHVLLWNDPVTLMHVVVRVLCKVFGYGPERAEQLMLAAHHEGRVVVWTGPRDRATRYCLELGANGLQSTVARTR